MSSKLIEESEKSPQDVIRYHWWEPYSFTASLFVGIAIVMVVLGYIGSFPYVQPALFGMATLLSIVSAFRKTVDTPSAIVRFLAASFFALACYAYFSQGEPGLAGGFGAMAIAWFGLTIHAVLLNRSRRKERLAKLDRAINSIGDVFVRDGKSERPESGSAD